MAPMGPKRALTGQPLLFPRAVRCGGIGPDWPRKTRTGREKAPISPEKARFSKADKLQLKPPFVSPRYIFQMFENGEGGLGRNGGSEWGSNGKTRTF